MGTHRRGGDNKIMRFHYDLMGGKTLIQQRKGIGTFYYGAGVCRGATDGTNIGTVIPATGLYANFAGMANEALTTTGTLANANVEDLEVITNPFAVYLVEYDVASTGIAVASFTTLTLGFSCTDGKGHPNLGGGYIYRSTDPGAGELNMVDSSSVSTTTCSIVLEDTPTTIPTTDSKFHIIYPVGPYMIDLGDYGRKIDSNDLDSGGGTSGTDGLPVTIIDNYIQYGGEEMQRLVPNLHAELTGLDNKNIHFYADVCFFPGSIWVE